MNPVDAHSIRLLTPTDEVALGDARGVWVRRPRWPVIDAAVTDDADRAFARQEAVAAMGGALRLLADRGVSPPDAIQAARWKVVQLNLAARLGLQVAPTIVTNETEQIEQFRAAGRTVIKAVADARVRTAEVERYGSTEELLATDDLSGAAIAPVLVQRLIPKAADWRITMIGLRSFPVRMVTTGRAPIDIRSVDPRQIRYEVGDLATETSQRLVRFMSVFGLRFAAFDFVEDHAGHLWFLECNPSGQWAWLEGPTGLDMTGALLDLLLEPNE